LIRSAAETADENAPKGAYMYSILQDGVLPPINIPEIYLLFNAESGRLYVEKAAYLKFAKARLKMGQA
jgi:hypothetical protein